MIRKAEKKDSSRLAEILIFAKRKAYRKIFCDDDGSFNQLQVLPLALLYQDSNNALDGMYVYDDGIVKGLIHWKIEKDEVNLLELYVEPFFQHEGIGNSLMKYFLQTMREEKIEKATLWVLEENKEARALYEKYGWKENGARTFEDGYDVVLLQYELIRRTEDEV